MTKRYPVFLCEPHTAGGITTWSFWCPLCRRKHTHGAGPGHRVAHCHSDVGRRAWPDGYLLKLDPKHRHAPRSQRSRKQ
jgi:hypothetical protein